MREPAEGSGRPPASRLQRAKEFLEGKTVDQMDDLLQELLERAYPTPQSQHS